MANNKVTTYPPRQELGFQLEGEGEQTVVPQNVCITRRYTKAGHERSVHAMETAHVGLAVQLAIHGHSPMTVSLGPTRNEEVVP